MRRRVRRRLRRIVRRKVGRRGRKYIFRGVCEERRSLGLRCRLGGNDEVDVSQVCGMEVYGEKVLENTEALLCTLEG